MPKQTTPYAFKGKPAQVSALGVGTVEPAVTQPAQANTTGLTVANLEIQVNNLKAVLRTFGLIAP
jgi:hypothetical protein